MWIELQNTSINFNQVTHFYIVDKTITFMYVSGNSTKIEYMDIKDLEKTYAWAQSMAFGVLP